MWEREGETGSRLKRWFDQGREREEGEGNDLPAERRRGVSRGSSPSGGPSRENEFQVTREVRSHVHTSSRIWLKCKDPRRERERPGDKCASFETQFREPPPRVRKRARAKRSHAAGDSRGHRWSQGRVTSKRELDKGPRHEERRTSEQRGGWVGGR